MRSSRTSASRACDGCKRRKVKCDASMPCANCRISHLDCAYTIPRKKRGPRTFPRTPDPTSPATQTPSSGPSDEQHTQQSIGNDLTSTDGFALWRFAAADDLEAAAASPDSARSPQSIQECLIGSLKSAIPSVNVLEVANYCIDLYMQFTFPTAPLVYEPALRANAALFFFDPSAHPFVETGNEQERISRLRGFALVTAVCASVASVMPDSLIPYRHVLVKPFLHASRETLRSFEDYDLEHPNSSSLAIRVFHSTALQHMTGKHGAAWHVQGEATLIAQNLRLYSEQAVQRSDSVESQLLRLHFWHMYASDHMAAAFQDRSIVLHESLFYEDFTLQAYPQQRTPLMDPSKPYYDESFEARLLAGFHLFQRVSSMAARLVLNLRKRESARLANERAQLAQAYIEYIGLVDSLPPWLHISQLETSNEDGEMAKFHKGSFWVQRCTILITFHCMRLVILRQCIHSKMWEIMGLGDDPHGLSMRGIEMISDFLQALEDVPFIYLKVKGEPTVERIRRVGSILLELMQTVVSNEAIKARAEAYSRRLLDILATLNSKASDNLDGIGLDETLELGAT